LWGEVATLADPVDPAFVRAFQESTLARPVPPAFLDTMVGESLKLTAATWRAVLAGLMAADATPELGRIAVPSLLLWGDRDSLVTRADQEALLAAIPASRLVVHAGAGHAPHWEDPARVAAEIADFVVALPDARRAA
jgi:non-heme chloroperoxidase